MDMDGCWMDMAGYWIDMDGHWLDIEWTWTDIASGGHCFWWTLHLVVLLGVVLPFLSWSPSDGVFGRFDLAALLRLPHLKSFVVVVDIWQDNVCNGYGMYAVLLLLAISL
jgi:hypothetical protein